MGICKRCGLPEEICACKAIVKEATKIKVYTAARRFGKLVTVIEGIESMNAKEIAKKLKSKLAAGGTYKEGKIEIQGNHKGKVKEILINLGFSEEQIEVS